MKPYVVCHMMASVDGRIDCDMTERIGGDEYYDALAQLDCDSDLSGRTTMQMHFALPEPFVPADKSPVGKVSFHKAVEASGYTIGLDSKGKLQWPGCETEGRRLLVVTSEDAPQEYVDRLSAQGISWIAVGKGEVDLSSAVEMLGEHFGVKRLAVVGGGTVNGAFLKAGLLDEVSLVIGAGIDGRRGMTAVFDGIEDMSYPVTLLKLDSVQRIGDDAVWLRYSFRS